jgi:hypothetical protein
MTSRSDKWGIVEGDEDGVSCPHPWYFFTELVKGCLSHTPYARSKNLEPHHLLKNHFIYLNQRGSKATLMMAHLHLYLRWTKQLACEKKGEIRVMKDKCAFKGKPWSILDSFLCSYAATSELATEYAGNSVQSYTKFFVISAPFEISIGHIVLRCTAEMCLARASSKYQAVRSKRGRILRGSPWRHRCTMHQHCQKKR